MKEGAFYLYKSLKKCQSIKALNFSKTSSLFQNLMTYSLKSSLTKNIYRATKDITIMCATYSVAMGYLTEPPHHPHHDLPQKVIIAVFSLCYINHLMITVHSQYTLLQTGCAVLCNIQVYCR